MILRALAREAGKQLEAAGIPDARFEAEYLVRSAAGVSRAHYFAGAEATHAVTCRVAELVEERLRRVPAAYLAGEREFFGLAMEVGPGVLVPRPETETLVEAVLAELPEATTATVADVGTGSGCIAAAVGSERHGASIVAIDASAAALRYARRNLARHAPQALLVRGDLAGPVGRADVVVANLPYIPSGRIDALEPEVRDWEPREALDGGPDGMDLIRELVHDCATRLRPRLLALEVDAPSARAVAALGEGLGARGRIVRDGAGLDRVVMLRW